MYTTHFGLEEAPFTATPDPRFLYRTRAHEEAYATLLYGIRDRQGFIVLTGEVGTGKTTLLRRLMDELAGSMRFIFLYNTTLKSEELVDLICDELDLVVDACGHVKKLRLLNDFLLAEAERGGSVVLLVDEAQNLSAAALEHLRLISNLETARQKLLQIVLVGQPELRTRLDHPRLRQVKQRITIRYHLEPIPWNEVEAFIQHRLRVGGRHTTLFTSDAIRRIALYAGGIPRVINILSHAALLLAFAADGARVNGRMVEEAAADLMLTPQERGAKPRRLVARTMDVDPVDGTRAQWSSFPPARRWPWAATVTTAVLIAIGAGSVAGAGTSFVGHFEDVRLALVRLLPVATSPRTNEEPTPSKPDALRNARPAVESARHTTSRPARHAPDRR